MIYEAKGEINNNQVGYQDKMDFACRELDVSLDAIRGHNRSMELVAKRMAMVCFFVLTGNNFNEIGRKMNKNHASVSHLYNIATDIAKEKAKEMYLLWIAYGITPVVKKVLKKVPDYLHSTIIEREVEA